MEEKNVSRLPSREELIASIKGTAAELAEASEYIITHKDELPFFTWKPDGETPEQAREREAVNEEVLKMVRESHSIARAFADPAA